MALGAFESYTPHPSIPGAYNFNTPTGASYLASGDAAERLKQQLDLAPQPQKLASNDSSAGGMSVDPSQAAPAPQVSVNPGANMSGAGGIPVAAPPPQMSSEAPAAAAPQRSITGGAPPQPGAAPAGFGPNPQDYLRVTHTKPHWQDTTQKVVTEGAVQNPQLEEMYGKAFAAQMHADAAAAEATRMHQATVLEQSKVAAAQAASEAAELEKQQVARRATLQQGADEFNRVMSIKQDELQKASSKEVDQFRMYRGKPGAQIGAAIAGALGAFGSAFTHGPNFALDTINRQIDNDIAAQREEINRGVASKQNDIQRIKDKYNVDTGVAEKLLSISLTERAQALARQQAATVGGQEAQMRLDAIDQQLAAKNLATMQGIKDQIYGKAAVTAEQKFVQGGTAVSVDPALKATAQAAELLGKTGQGMGQAAAGAFQAQNEGRTAAQVDKAAGAGSKTNYTAQTKSAINAADAAKEQLRHAASLAGIHVNEETGEAHVVDWFRFAKAQSAYSDAAAAMRAAVPEIVRGQTGAKPSVDEEHAKEAEFKNPLGVLAAIQENYKGLMNSAQTRRANTFKSDTGTGGNEKQEEE